DACRGPRSASWVTGVPDPGGQATAADGAASPPRPGQRRPPPIWVGGSPGTVSGPAVRRCAELGDAWHPLALSLDDIEKGFATLRDLASRSGRRGALGLAPRNLLALTRAPPRGRRAPFQGSVPA